MNTIISFFKKVPGAFRSIGGYAMRHKVQAGIAILVLAGGSYYGYTTWKADHTPAQYVLASASLAPIETTVTGSGQVAASHELELSPKSSGTITSVNVKAGERVAAGQLIATIDSSDAQKVLRDASANLEGAKISYAQSIASSDTSTQDARDSGFDEVASAETSQPNVLTHLETLVKTNDGLLAYVKSIGTTEPEADTALNRARASYDAAVRAHDTAVAAYREASRTSSPQAILALTDVEYTSLVATTQAVKDTLAVLTLVDQTLKTHNGLEVPANLASDITQITGDTSAITSATTKVSTAKSLLTDTTRSLGSGVPLDVQSAQLSLTKSQNAYQDALDTLADYSVRAPFSGTIAKVNVQKFDEAGGSVAVATLITDQQYAELSLNETDAAKVKAGQKTTLTFDAIDGLSLEGTVAEIDQVGTVDQGVVSYTVKIGIESTDDRIRPGMTVNATIITASKEAALVVPAAAVKTQGDQYYIEVATANAGASNLQAGTASGTTGTSTRRMGMATTTAGGAASSTRTGAARNSAAATVSADEVTLKRVSVTIGLQSDTMTEVLTGLSAGDRVVTQTIAQSGKTTSSTAAPSLFGGSAPKGAAGGNASFRTTGATRAAP